MNNEPKVLIFISPDAFFETMFGPPQLDAHVEKWRGAEWLRKKRIEYDLRSKAVQEECERMCARIRESRT